MPDDRRTEEVRAEIARYRETLSETAVELREKVHELTDWHEWVAERPWSFVAGAFAIGFVIGYRGH